MKLVVETPDPSKGPRYEADLEEALPMLEALLDSGGHLHFHSECFSLDFHCLSDTSFEVELYDVRDGFWAICAVGIRAARRITEMVSANEKFGENIPTTDQIWDAYGGGQFA